MSIKFVVAHRKDPNNVGDIASNPLQYFLPQSEYKVIDVAEIGRESYPEELPMIVGGGGLIGNDFIGDVWTSLTESPDRAYLESLWQNTWSLSNPTNKEAFDIFHKNWHELVNETLDKISSKIGPRVIWGAGHNGDPSIEFEDIRWPKIFSKYKHVGIRDYHENSRIEWTPCASCMHPALRKQYAIKNDIIWFEHKKQLIKDFGPEPIPRFVNSGDNIEQTIELLGSANIILTNSYHGAYWGTLLKKKVIIVGGTWSTKFKWFRHPPTILGKKEDWQDAIDSSNIYNSALDECIYATEQYWNTIKGLG